ncbi:hypothetical protein Ae168Ps1_3645 [Pseudonocardia sp. Ae168_Ps1]|nr:hypothetical protein Ae150APs1_3623 [Pseudonocardia sp. Ae150A_Ps1]OLL81239.1 hypothetical protein Ae168Ps1_3645 [Pseudonocardia sp. Ae168_Ps1]OLL84646.1 hypothetical protein Ae263Ps1_1701c [Pseudonocardia sp. Ae263_Ps1]OLL95337.1 hypothetical protein Ae356Ps1_5234 [Pseudonocardia sp. Ae356_Ps1]
MGGTQPSGDHLAVGVGDPDVVVVHRLVHHIDYARVRPGRATLRE